MPVEDGLLALHHDDAAPGGVGGGVGEGEADAQPADEHGRAGGAAPAQGAEGGVDEEPLGAAVGRVHQEGAVGDDLEVFAAPPQHDFAVRAFTPVECLGHALHPMQGGRGGGVLAACGQPPASAAGPPSRTTPVNGPWYCQPSDV